MGTSSNPKSFEREGFASIPAKILGEGEQNPPPRVLMALHNIQATNAMHFFPKPWKFRTKGTFAKDYLHSEFALCGRKFANLPAANLSDKFFNMYYSSHSEQNSEMDGMHVETCLILFNSVRSC